MSPYGRKLVEDPKTQGISPKVYLPVAGMFVAGIVLILVGLDVEGRTLIATALGTLGVGAAANPGTITANPSDAPQKI